MIKKIAIKPGELAPESYERFPNFGWGTTIRCIYGSMPTERDCFNFSASIGYGDVMLGEGGYLVSKPDIQPDGNKWIAEWGVIED